MIWGELELVKRPDRGFDKEGYNSRLHEIENPAMGARDCHVRIHYSKPLRSVLISPTCDQ